MNSGRCWSQCCTSGVVPASASSRMVLSYAVIGDDGKWRASVRGCTTSEDWSLAANITSRISWFSYAPPACTMRRHLWGPLLGVSKDNGMRETSGILA